MATWVKTFLIGLAIGLLAIGVSLAVALSVLSYSEIERHREVYAIVIAGVGLFLGTAATLAGAIATGRLASATIAISAASATRDAHRFVEDRLDSAVEAFSGLALALSEVLVTGLLLENLASGLGDLSVKLDGEAEARRAREFARALSEARTRLVEVKINRLARSAYQRKLGTLESGLEYITARWTATGAVESEVEVAPSDFTEIVNFMTLAADRVGGSDDLANEIRTAALQANFVQETAAAYDHAALRSLMFTGNLIWNRTTATAEGTLSVVAYGAAMLSDIYRCIPSGDELLEQLRLTYPELGPVGPLAALEFDPREVVGKTFAFAADELSRRTQVLFVASEPDVSP